LFGQQALDQRVHIQTEIDPQCNRAAVDAWLDLAAEEGLARVFPSATIFD
jgi:hypothetical protein